MDEVYCLVDQVASADWIVLRCDAGACFLVHGQGACSGGCGPGVRPAGGEKQLQVLQVPEVASAGEFATVAL